MVQHTIGLFIANPVDLRLLADFLRSLGFEVHAHGLSSGVPVSLPGTSLIIADEEAASRYGRRVLDLKWRSGIGFLPILILLPRQASSAHWIEAGFDDVLRQPISKQELKARLNVFLRFREQSEEYRRIFENALIGIFRCAGDGICFWRIPHF